MKLEIVKISTKEFLKNFKKDKLIFLQSGKKYLAYYNGKLVGKIYRLKN